MEEMQSAMKDLKDYWEGNWNEEKTQMGNISRDLNEHQQQLADWKERETNGAVEMKQLKSQLEQHETLINTLTEQITKLLGSVESQSQGAMVGPDEVQKQTQVSRYVVNLNGVLMTMAKTQMPHDQLHSMTLVYEWNIRDIKIKYGTWDDTRESEVFPLAGYHYGAKANIDTDGWIQLQLIDYNKTKRPIDMRTMPKVTWVFVSQSHKTQDNKYLKKTQHSTDGITTGFIQFNQSLEYGRNVCDAWSLSSIYQFTCPPYVVSSRMKVRVYIEPPSIARSFFSNDGILLWRLDNYKERKQMEVDGLIWWQESPYFYTSPQGYRVFIRLRLNEETVRGDLLFVKGEFDSSLTQQFPHRLTMTIFNHTDQSKNLVISIEGKEADCSGCYLETASASLLESGGYVADDSLLIKAVVEPL